MRTRDELLEALLVERHTPIPPHRVLPASESRPELPPLPQEVRDRMAAAERIVAERLGSDHRIDSGPMPWTTREIQVATRRRLDGKYEMSARQCGIRLGRSVHSVEHIRSKRKAS